MVDIFGPIFVADTVENAVIDTISTWLATYLQEIEVQRGMTRGSVPLIRSYATRNEWATYPEDQLPVCIVVSTGLADPPDVDGEGRYHGWWAVGVGVLAGASESKATEMLAKLYGAAIRAILLQRPSLGGIASGIEWEDESYDDVPVDQDRTLAATLLLFRVWIDDIVTRGAGPAEPIPPDPVNQPGSQWPTADTIDVQVESVPLDEEVNP